jgi:hypothetical protein
MHLPQVPFPPHGASIATSALFAHAISEVPDGAVIVLLDGWKVTTGII